MTTQRHPKLAVVGRTTMRRQLISRFREAARDAAYRRLATTILGLDVATLAAELSAARLNGAKLARAA